MTLNLPKVRYHTTVYIEENQSMFVSCVGTHAVENVIKVLNGSLESVLHLIGYSFPQIRKINRKLSIKFQTNQKSTFDLSCLENHVSEEMKMRPSRAHIVQYEDRLYGVVVDEGRARICGQIRRINFKMGTDGQSSVLSRGIKVSKTYSEGQQLECEKELRKHLESGQNIVLVSDKGAVFLVPNDNPTAHQYENQLTLILGHGFVIINEPTVHWIRSKQLLREERRESTQLLANESIIVSFAAICVGVSDIKVCGAGSVINIKNIKEFYATL